MGDAAAVGVQKMKKSRGCLGWSVAVAVEETEGEADVADEEGNATAGGLGFGGDLRGKGGLAFVNRDREACGRPWFFLFLLQERGMAPLLFVKGRLCVQAAQVFGYKGRGASRFNRERGKNGGFGFVSIFFEGREDFPG